MIMKRKRANKMQLVTYSNGKLCRRGHFSLRYTSTGMCVACLQMRYQKNKEGKVYIKVGRENFFIDEKDKMKLIDKIHELNFNREFDLE